jgi:drug/metabolite transporter (DMT)-like permease
MAANTHISALPLTDAAPANNRNLVLIALVSVYIIWGSTYLGIAVALESFPPFLLGTLRFGLSAGVLFAWLLLVRREALPSPRQMLNAMLVGILTLGVGTTAVAIAEQYVSSGLAALAVAIVPLWTAAFAVLWLGRPTKLEWIGMLVGFSGIVLLNLDKGMSAQPQGALPLIVGPIAWSLGSILSRRLSMPSGFMAIAFELLGAFLVVFVITIATGAQPKGEITTNSILAILYLASFGSLVGYTAFMYLFKTVTPSVATSYAYVNPVVALLLGVVFLGEAKHITPLVVIAMIVTLSGVVLVGYASAQRRKMQA